jgi:NADPH-dependent 7-cyano-7-deazaguanine reductase QueF
VLIRTVPAPTGLLVEFEAPVEHRCPYADETDHDVVRVTWHTTNGWTLEFHDLLAFLREFRDLEISREDLAHAIRVGTSEHLDTHVELDSRQGVATISIVSSSRDE